MQSRWQRAQGQHVPHIVAMAKQHFEQEADTIFRTDPHVYAHNVAMAVVNQMYNPWGELVMVATQADRVIAYVWARRGERAPWAADEMAVIRIAHVDLDLPLRTRMRLVQDMIGLWETWAAECGISVICSTTMRGDQQGFLRLHERAGYLVRGSVAYKRLTAFDTQGFGQEFD